MANAMKIVAIVLISAMSMSPLIMSIHNHPNGFTIDMIHKEYSPLSPFFNSSLSPYERRANVLLSQKQRRRGSVSGRVPDLDIKNSEGEYLIEFYIGTPPVQTLSILDTGSDLIWTQCKPCPKCFSQSLRIFDPIQFYTYEEVYCGSVSCKQYVGTSCHRKHCLYSVRYVDGTYSNGAIGSDSFTFKSDDGTNIKVPLIDFGCGTDNGGVNTRGPSGIVGLGGGTASLPKQLGLSIKEKFSYCLVPFPYATFYTSKLHFGVNAVVEGPGVTVLPLVNKEPATFYHVTFTGIRVGPKSNIRRFEYIQTYSLNGSKATDEGNMIVDSGTTTTYIPKVLYDQLVADVLKNVKLPVVKDPTETGGLCFHIVGGLQIKYADLTLEFVGGNLRLAYENVFSEDGAETRCLAFRPRTQGLFVLGSDSQANHLVGIDFTKRTVSFKYMDCISR